MCLSTSFTKLLCSKFIHIDSCSSSFILTTVWINLFLYPHLEGVQSKIIYIIFSISLSEINDAVKFPDCSPRGCTSVHSHPRYTRALMCPTSPQCQILLQTLIILTVWWVRLGIDFYFHWHVPPFIFKQIAIILICSFSEVMLSLRWQFRKICQPNIGGLELDSACQAHSNRWPSSHPRLASSTKKAGGVSKEGTALHAVGKGEHLASFPAYLEGWGANAEIRRGTLAPFYLWNGEEKWPLLPRTGWVGTTAAPVSHPGPVLSSCCSYNSCDVICKPW